MAQLPAQPLVPPGQIRTADLLGALSLAADLAVGLPEEHAVRACYIGMQLAERLGLSHEQRAALYYAELLMDAGCTAWTSQFAAAVLTDEIVARREFFYFSDDRSPLDLLSWLKDYVGTEAPAPQRAKRVLDFAVHGRAHVREAFRNTCEVAQRFAGRLGMPAEVQGALLSVFEQWDGHGPRGARGEQIPIVSRIVYATSFIEVFHRMGGRGAALRLARRRRGSAFDPAVVDAFLAVARDAAFWAGLEQETVWPAVLALEPDSPCRTVAAEQLEEVTLAFADFADLKSIYSAGHSRRTAALAESMAAQLRLSEPECSAIRHAALIHDLGLVAIPSFTLQKPEAQRGAVERERLRLHPYHAERILAGVPALAPALPLIAAHHERLDGRGYYRGLAGSQIPLGARLIAVADRFDELTHGSPDHPALDPREALRRLNAEAGSGLCPRALGALDRVLEQGAADGAAGARPRRRAGAWPAGLSDREVEILRLLARGAGRREIAGQLVLSEHTVRHHLEHIYNKIGVSTRVAAALFAVERGLLA